MKNNLETALEYLGPDYLLNASIIEPIKCGTVDILYAEEDCVLVRDKASGVLMMQTENAPLAEKLLRDTSERELVVAHNRELAEFLMRELGYNNPVPCYQAVYRGKPFDLKDTGELKIRLMREDEAEIAYEIYFHSIEAALEHIRRGLVYGGYVNGEAACTIGMHMQGAMGILEVKENFRRRGYGEIMEKFLINALLGKGLVPYCHVVEGNVASLALQSKLGLEISKDLLYWLHMEPRN